MAVRKVIRMGNPTLRLNAKTFTIEEIKSQETEELVQDMIDTMEAEDGIGIAAPQIGVSKQVALIGAPEDSERYPELDSSDPKLYVIFNPKIKILDEELQGFWEGCLSVPGLRGFVKRPRKVQIDYLNINGEEESVTVEDFNATIFQHELDHLFGTLYVDRVKDSKLLMYTQELEEFHLPKEEDE